MIVVVYAGAMATTRIGLDVPTVYSKIAKDFDRTRYAPWPGVCAYLDSLKSGVTVLDAGCGNGKYLGYRQDLRMIGCDACLELVELARAKHSRVAIYCMDLRRSSAMIQIGLLADHAICIAVLHHMRTVDERMTVIRNVMSAVKPHGTALFTVWTPSRFGHGDAIVPWRDVKNGVVHERYYHIFSKDELMEMIQLSGSGSGSGSEYNIVRVWDECDNIYCLVRHYTPYK